MYNLNCHWFQIYGNLKTKTELVEKADQANQPKTVGPNTARLFIVSNPGLIAVCLLQRAGLWRSVYQKKNRCSHSKKPVWWERTRLTSPEVWAVATSKVWRDSGRREALIAGKYVVSDHFNDQNTNSHLLPLFISYRTSGEKLIKYQANSSCVIMSVILMTTPFPKVLILQGEIWCWSLWGLKGLNMVLSLSWLSLYALRCSEETKNF